MMLKDKRGVAKLIDGNDVKHDEIMTSCSDIKRGAERKLNAYL